MSKGPKKKYDWYKNPVVEDLEEGSYDYIMTQEWWINSERQWRTATRYFPL